ncbi:hypothetical protein [Agrococcus sp. SGAir0287]|uniref:hypothetical protein n=1 Tax=Agrococcus sp. SGAir0287 TaxID=2070347 RepID=UPI0010CCF838|nr:hypothetical protein [Agrococcus sp. SGAir0287]QCR19955.1 hypothetical protein C1N71_11355 [Agrococcus sp. SGAir0287]
MPSRRLLALPVVAALLLSACATTSAVSDDPSPVPSASPSSTPTPTPSPTPTEAGPEPTAAAGSPIALTPLAPATDVTAEQLQAYLPVASDMPSGWVQGYNDYAAIPYAPTFEPCGPSFWYVLGSPLESDVPSAEVRWASSGDVSAPPFPVSIGALLRATPDAASAFARIAADLETCPAAGTTQSGMTASLRSAPPTMPDAVCGDLLPADESTQGVRQTFCVGAVADRIAVVSYNQFAPPQLELSDEEIDAAFGAALARMLG